MWLSIKFRLFVPEELVCLRGLNEEQEAAGAVSSAAFWAAEVYGIYDSQEMYSRENVVLRLFESRRLEKGGKTGSITVSKCLAE